MNKNSSSFLSFTTLDNVTLSLRQPALLAGLAGMIAGMFFFFLATELRED